MGHWLVAVEVYLWNMCTIVVICLMQLFVLGLWDGKILSPHSTSVSMPTLALGIADCTSLFTYGVSQWCAQQSISHRMSKCGINPHRNMYCVLSVNASVARAASVGYCLKMVHTERNWIHWLSSPVPCTPSYHKAPAILVGTRYIQHATLADHDDQIMSFKWVSNAAYTWIHWLSSPFPCPTWRIPQTSIRRSHN